MHLLRNLLKTLIVAGAVLAAQQASAGLIITEVDASGSGASYGADWFELTNNGSSAVDISGWKMDDSSGLGGSAAAAVTLRGVTSIAAGQSVIFLESNSSGSNDSGIGVAFKSAWFGSNVPTGLTLGFYGGSGVGLSTTAGDGVSVFDSSGTLKASVSFGVADATRTFDNAAGLNGAISQLSATGVNGSLLSANGAEIGSPGVVPLPAACWLLLSGFGLLAPMMRRRVDAVT